MLGLLIAGICGLSISKVITNIVPEKNVVFGGAPQVVKVLDYEGKPLLSFHEMTGLLEEISVDHLFVIPCFVNNEDIEFVFTKHDGLYAYCHSVGKYTSDIKRTLSFHYKNVFSSSKKTNFEKLQYVLIHYNNNSLLIFVINEDTLQLKPEIAQTYKCIADSALESFHSFAARDHNILANKVIEALDTNIKPCDANEEVIQVQEPPKKRKPVLSFMKFNESDYVKMYIMSYITDPKIMSALEKFPTEFKTKMSPALQTMGLEYNPPKYLDNSHFTVFHVCIHRDIFEKIIDKKLDSFVQKLKDLCTILEKASMIEVDKGYSIYGEKQDKRFVGKSFKPNNIEVLAKYHNEVLSILQDTINEKQGGHERINFKSPSSHIFFMDESGKTMEPLIFFKDYYWDVHLTDFHISLGTITSANNAIPSSLNKDFPKKHPLTLTTGNNKANLGTKIRLTFRNVDDPQKYEFNLAP
jgi:hypothetical protein